MGVWLFSDGCESSVWEKYATTAAAVHMLACDVEKSRRIHKPGTDFQYYGFCVGQCRPDQIDPDR